MIRDTERYRAVLLRNTNASKDNAFNGEDGTIVLYGASGGVAIESVGGSDVVLKNVFVSGAKTIVACARSWVRRFVIKSVLFKIRV